MSDEPNKTSDTGETAPDEILTELRELGKNLQDLLRSVWESEERKKVQREIETGLSDLTSTLTKAAKDFSDSPAAKGIKTDLEDLGQRIRTGEVETKVRTEVIDALRTANQGLKKASQSRGSSETQNVPDDQKPAE